MSGSAALSAARKRRASSSQMGAGGTTNPQQQPTPYYSGSKQSLQGIMNQGPAYPNVSGVPPGIAPSIAPSVGKVPAYTIPKEGNHNVPINIYENIELIKQQLSERTKLIQTQGSSIPPEKLRVLHKQNEIQTQILRQKMAIAQQMELAEQQKQQELQQQYEAQKQGMNQSPFNPNEPEFIYEKGIPRKNPRYRKPEDVVNLVPIQVPPQYPPPAPHHNQVHPQSLGYTHYQPTVAQRQSQMNTKLSPFVSMITDTGVIPPPIVILKAHDATLEEHHYVIQNMVKQVEDLQVALNDKNNQLPTIKEESIKKDMAPTPNQQTDSAMNDNDSAQDETEESELLMDVVMNDLTNSREFIEGIVDKIVNETNLSEVIMKIEPIVKENQELRSLIHSQQQMMNEMNMMLFRLLNEHEQQKAQIANAAKETTITHVQDNVMNEPVERYHFNDEGLNGDGLYSCEMTEIILSQPPLAENSITIETNKIQEDDHHKESQDVEVEQQHDGDYNQDPDVEPDDDNQQSGHDDHNQDQDGDHEYEYNEEQEPMCITPTDDDYSDMPHFPEPISLIVSEL